MKKTALLAMTLAAFSMTACQTLQNQGQKERIGSVSGAVLGGILGSKVGGGSGRLWATGAGVLLGTLAGSEIGRSLDTADRSALQTATSRARTAPIGETISWNNPQSGNSGTITPVRDGNSTAGRYCREYQQTITIGGREETGYGTACQQPDGDWEIMS